MNRHLQRFRPQTGSIAGEHMAALIVLFLAIMYPLCNLATVGYRYGLVVQAVHNGAHNGSTANTFTAGSAPSGQVALMDVVPATTNHFLSAIKGISNTAVEVRLVQSKLADQSVTRLGNATRLGGPPDPGSIYSVELSVTTDIDPLITFKNNLVPNVPGMTGPMRVTVVSRELLENPSQMNI